jgi:23S rRNA pseudouridine1911/1915/1917 synthase
METFQHHLTIPPELEGKRLDQVLAELLPDYSRSRLKEWILAGNVSVDGEHPQPRTRVRSGQQVALTATMETESAYTPEQMDIVVRFEDDAVLIIDKPAGLVVHPGAGNQAGTLMNGLLHGWPGLAALPRSGILHRLDKDTSGLLLVAKTLPAHTHLVRALQERGITREYRAVCEGRLTAGGSIDAPIGRHPVHRTRMAVVARGRESVTHYRVLTRFAAHTLLALRLETGRTHQIRVHMAHQRHALVGDSTYGGRLKIPAGASAGLTEALRCMRRQALHASRLAFRHPVTDAIIEIQSSLPADFIALLQALDGVGRSGSGKSAAERWDTLQWPAPASN